MKMANIRGRKAKVKFYKYGESKPYKTVVGKVVRVHTSQSVRDTDTIEIMDDEQKIQRGGYTNYFVVDKVYPRNK